MLAAGTLNSKFTCGCFAPIFRGRLIYNAGIALFLAYLGTVAHIRGRLLWAAVA
jgi:hypothetical protein